MLGNCINLHQFLTIFTTFPLSIITLIDYYKHSLFCLFEREDRAYTACMTFFYFIFKVKVNTLKL